ncbi:unknown [Ruminococcus sp. CAG:382]|nr:unknown [Ruminococcus sp. CAG:382]
MTSTLTCVPVMTTATDDSSGSVSTVLSSTECVPIPGMKAPTESPLFDSAESIRDSDTAELPVISISHTNSIDENTRAAASTAPTASPARRR